jgi:hypothetical protein
MLFSDGKEKPKALVKKEDNKVYGFFILQSEITPNTEPIHFEMGEPKYADAKINYKIIKSNKHAKLNKHRSGPLF